VSRKAPRPGRKTNGRRTSRPSAYSLRHQQHRASGLNLLVNRHHPLDTRYLERAVAAFRQVQTAPDPLLAHFSPLGSEHINLTGDYVWGAPHSVSENLAGF
jgi:2-hydroxychromene-2-carboxylate isomerase